MRESGIEEREVAHRSGMSRSALRNLVAGKHSARMDTFFAIIDACDFEIVELRVRRKQ
jgi:transcriptional regulator with XRE-family HTH domain